MPACPVCASSQAVKNGHIHNGKQQFKCRDCGRQFVEQPTKKVIDPTRDLFNRLLLERLSPAGIARAVGVSEQWLQIYVNETYAKVPRTVQVTLKKRGGRAIQCDELWSFVDNKGNKQWVWLALDADTREIVGVYIGARDAAVAHRLWASLPPVYRQCAIACTDFWQRIGQCYRANDIVPWVKKQAKLATLSRFNNTLRQRVSRLVRKTLSFSKSLENYIGAAWYFIHHYNTSLLV